LGFILNFGYKWLGEKKVDVLTVDNYPGWFSKRKGVNDKPLLKHALQIMEEADLMVAHYGDKFDRRFFQGRCAIHDLTPPPPTKQRDTWRIAKSAFCFSSNRLGALAMTLGLYEQKHVKQRNEWPGWWVRAMAGDKNAIHQMAEYCAQDVRTTEAVYLRIRQYDNPHPRMYTDRGVCGVCGGKVQYRGFAYVGVNKYRRYRCSQCGKWGRETKAWKD
jgi:hypothetical protein